MSNYVILKRGHLDWAVLEEKIERTRYPSESAEHYYVLLCGTHSYEAAVRIVEGLTLSDPR